MVMCDYDANTIFGEATPDRKSVTLQKAFLRMLQKLKLKGCSPSIIRLDN